MTGSCKKSWVNLGTGRASGGWIRWCVVLVTMVSLARRTLAELSIWSELTQDFCLSDQEKQILRGCEL